jgi:cytochrome b involved in lipid metabolism
MSKVFTSKEVSEHKTVENGLWVVIDGGVYDLTQFINEHPGGPKILKRSAGKDASKSFWKVSEITAALLAESDELTAGCSTTATMCSRSTAPS